MNIFPDSYQAMLQQQMSNLGGGLLSGLFGGTTATSSNTSAIYQLQQRQIKFYDPNEPAPPKPPAEAKTHCEWLDRRVNEMRVKL